MAGRFFVSRAIQEAKEVQREEDLQFTVGISSLLFVLAAAAQTPPPDARLVDNPVFQKICEKCHGKTADTCRHFGGPQLVSDEAMAKSADELREIITNGKHHMPKYAGKTHSGGNQHARRSDQIAAQEVQMLQLARSAYLALFVSAWSGIRRHNKRRHPIDHIFVSYQRNGPATLL